MTGSDFPDTVLLVNALTTFSPNSSQFGPGAADLELHILGYFLLSRNRETIKFGSIQVL